MLRNQGTLERTIRVIAGAALIVGAWADRALPHTLGLVLAVVGVVLLVTGTIAYCPAWHLLGVSTAKK